ncbi:meiosis-specific component of sister chromatid cohesion complex [Schistosoma haematobium]|nr:meiosis-specific component of sister chromatid cohesion complex [Schistosoma haematobium]KAH9586876.1 meiosis-specific component of sister chromatid cohesion complex [Schistosoma haematobium]
MDSVNAISTNVDSSLMPSAQFSTEIINNSTHLENIKQSNVVLEQVELTKDFLTETEMTQILPQEEEERTFTSASEQNLCPISLSRLNPLHPVESEENTHRRRIKKHSNKLIIDEITRLTASELRWNMLHGEETMVTRDIYLADSTPRSQTRYLLSRSVSRLFSVPSNLETALSLRLCELWCYHRRLCEKALQKRKLDDLSLNNDVIQTKRPAKSLSIKMNAITEENESSVEIQRIAGDHSSLIGSESIFGTSNIIDVTNNQTISVRESLVQMKESFGGASDQPIPDIVTNVRDNTASEITRQALDLPIPGTSISLPTECTTLVPVIEEPEENLQQQNELDSTSVVPNLTEALPDQSQLPTEVSSLTGKHFHDKSQLWRYLYSQLIESNSYSIDIGNLCPLGCSKKQAAFVFMTLLEFAKNRQIILSQCVAFGQILITIIH